MSASDSLENNFLDVFVGNSATSATLQLGALGLNVGDPTDAGSGGSEASGGGYARVAVSNTDFAAASGGSISTSGAVSFPESTGTISSGSTLSHVRFETATTAGTFLGSLALTTGRAVSASGVTLQFASGALTLTAD